MLLDPLVRTAARSGLLRDGGILARIPWLGVGVRNPKQLGRRLGGAHVVARDMDEAHDSVLLAAPSCSIPHVGDLLEPTPAKSGPTVQGFDPAPRAIPGSLRKESCRIFNDCCPFGNFPILANPPELDHRHR